MPTMAMKLGLCRLYPDPNPPYERTGAGDAFSSTFVSALAMGKTIEEASLMAPINSMSVVQKSATKKALLTLPEIEKFLQQAPVDYKPAEDKLNLSLYNSFNRLNYIF